MTTIYVSQNNGADATMTHNSSRKAKEIWVRGTPFSTEVREVYLSDPDYSHPAPVGTHLADITYWDHEDE